MKNLYKTLILMGLLLTAAGLSAQCPVWQAPVSPVTVCDTFTNNPHFWNRPVFYDAGNLVKDLFEMPVPVGLTVVDTCHPVDRRLSCALWMDLDGNGVRETVVWSDALPGIDTIFMGNAGNPGFTGGTPQAFDHRIVTSGNRYGFVLESIAAEDTLTARLRLHTLNAPDSLLDPILPGGKHLLQWFIESGGTLDTVAWELEIKDCKPPELSLIPQIPNYTVVAWNQKATVWVSDLVLTFGDNISPQIYPATLIGIRKAGAGTGFPFEQSGFPQTSVVYTCDNLGNNPVEVWGKDAAGNASHINTVIKVVNTQGVCEEGSTSRVCLQSEDGTKLPPWRMHAVQNVPGVLVPMLDTMMFDSIKGCYEFNNIGFDGDFNYSAYKEDEPLRGVSTFDLLLISKHILGIQPLPSPYKIIAADANQNGAVTTFDIVELRKLILGITSQLPNNITWRYVDATFQFPNPSNPFLTNFPDTIHRTSLNGFVTYLPFIGIKIGDVNNSYGVNGSSEERGDVAYLAMPDVSFAESEYLDLPIYVSETTSWQGLQFELDYDQSAVEIVDIQPGTLPGIARDNFNNLGNKLRCSWVSETETLLPAGTTIATLRVHVRKQAHAQDVFDLIENTLEAAAYGGEETMKYPLTLQFGSRPEPEAGITGPWPNPSRGAVHWTVRDNQAASTLVIYDFSGKKLLSRGFLGSTVVEESIFPASGVYFWEITSGSERYSGKIIR